MRALLLKYTSIAALTALLSVQSVFAQSLAENLTAGFQSGALPGLHSTMVKLDDQKLAEVYFEGKDENWGDDLGMRTHSPSSLHDLRSVTKSIVGLLYGIALGEGKVPAPDQPLYTQFPQYPDLMAEKGREQILVRHALSMQMGLEWNENLPYTDPKNSEVAMERAPDRYRFALEQPIREAPGKSWIYSGGAVAILAKLIEQGTGMSLDAYAQQKLFTPLGISNFEWAAGADGVPSAASGLRLTLPDLSKIGEMVAQDGAFNGQQIVPADWLNTAFTPQVTLNQHTKYGYLWYLSGPPNNIVVFGAGNGGQRLTVQPNHDLVVTTFAGRYNDPNGWQTSLKIVLEYAVPAATAMLTR